MNFGDCGKAALEDSVVVVGGDTVEVVVMVGREVDPVCGDVVDV